MIDPQFMLSVNKFLLTEFKASQNQTDLISELLLLSSRSLFGQESSLMVDINEFEHIEDYEQRLSFRERLLTFLEPKINEYEIKPRDIFTALITSSNILSKKLEDSLFNSDPILKPNYHLQNTYYEFDEEVTSAFNEFMTSELSQDLVCLASQAHELRVSQHFDEALPLAEKFLDTWKEHIKLWEDTFDSLSDYLYQGDFDVWSVWMMRMYVILQEKGRFDSLMEYAKFLDELPKECLFIDFELFNEDYRRFSLAFETFPKIIRLIKSDPGISQRDVYKKLSIPGQINQWMFEYSEKLGVIKRVRDGKSLRLHIV